MAHFEGEGGEDAVLPRFLRDDSSHNGPLPPPLPRQPGRVVQLLKASVPGGLGMRALLLLAALAPAAAGGLYLEVPKSPPSVPAPIAAQRPLNEVAEALKLVAAVEARLAFAEDPQTLAAAATASAEAAVEAEVVPHEPDPIGMLLLSNVPEGATFEEGLQTGIGTWAMPGGDPNQLITALGEGFEKPALVDVELISRSGQPLGALKVTLQKPLAAGPVAAAAPSNTGVAEEAEPEAKPAKRKRHAHRTYRIARSNLGGLRQRRVAVDAYQVRPAAAKADASTDKPNEADANAATEGEKPSGPIAKLFNWLKGGSNKQDAPAVAEQPQEEDHIRRGLGMAPAE
jgi:hypothetical protein